MAAATAYAESDRTAGTEDGSGSVRIERTAAVGASFDVYTPDAIRRMPMPQRRGFERTGLSRRGRARLFVAAALGAALFVGACLVASASLGT